MGGGAQRQGDAMTSPTEWLALDWMLCVIVGWLLVGIAGVFALRRFSVVARVLFPAGGVVGLALFGVALVAVAGSPELA